MSLQEATLQRNVNFVDLENLTEQLGAQLNFSSAQCMLTQIENRSSNNYVEKEQ